MCRMMSGSKKALEEYEEENGLKKLLDHLEKQCGGEGNGICLVKGRKIVHFEKGVRFQNKDIVRILMEEDYDNALYHTRVRSMGSRGNRDCHPFLFGGTVLAHNGTELGFYELSGATGMSDSELIARLISTMEPWIALKALLSTQSVYMGYLEGIPFVVNARGQCSCWRDRVWASTFPWDVEGWRPLPDGTVVIGGEERQSWDLAWEEAEAE